MRACGSAPQFVDVDGRVGALNLPADFCAEHEWGIAKLKRFFGITDYKSAIDGPLGIERRKATKAPSSTPDNYGYTDFLYEEKTNLGGMSVGYHIWSQERTPKKLFEHPPHDLKNCYNHGTRGAWNESSFAVFTAEVAKLRELKERIDEMDVCVYVGGKTIAFENPGLVIAVASAIPQEYVDKMYKDDEDRRKLEQESLNTGIEKELKLAGKAYFALSPSWISQQKKSQYKVMYWLNPQQQDKYSFGWFTVEELRQWIKDKGPVMIK